MWCFDYEKVKKSWVGEIGQVGEKGYNYLGVLDVWKKTLGKNTLRGWEQQLKSNLNATHVFQAINTWVVPTVRYGAVIIKWTK